VLSFSPTMHKSYTNWYDPTTNLWQIAPKMTKCHQTACLCVIKDKFVLTMGDVDNLSSQSVEMLDVSLQSPCWVPLVDMNVKRKNLGVGVLDDCVYAVCYTNI